MAGHREQGDAPVSISLMRWPATAFAIGLFTVLLFGCVAPGGYGGGVAVGADYYEPFGVDYGGWGPGYQVAPFRGGYRRPGFVGGGRAPQHTYRPAPASRPMPSIPSRARPSGGARRP
jgi:hypothetical protein